MILNNNSTIIILKSQYIQINKFEVIYYEIMMKPQEPTRDDCCNSDCNPCIFDVYERQLKLYEKYKNQGDELFNLSDYGISQLEYTTFYLLDVVQLSKTQKILMFKKLKQDQCHKVWWKPGDHFLIKYTSVNKESCTRAYTPIKFRLGGICPKDYDFLIVVKKYDNGFVSKYLFNLAIGEETIWRGPYGSYSVQNNKYSRIVMIAQGTGIAPFLSIIQSILSNEEDMTRMVLYYCCKENEMLFRDELYEFNLYWNFSYKVFLRNGSNELKNIKYNEPIVKQKFNINELDLCKSNSNDQYLLCGSMQFMKEYEIFLKSGNYSDCIILL